VGKYINLPDAYLSVTQALQHAGFHHRVEVEVVWCASDELEDPQARKVLETVDGILVPGGFGIRGVEGKVEASRFARERRVPYLGICLGLQCAVIDVARNLAGMEGANSSEFDPDTPFAVIDLLPDQRRVADKGGTMRLGLDPCRLQRGSKAERAYGDGLVFERHRHRYEVNNRFRRRLEDAGLVCSGTSPDGRLVEIIELPDHPWFVAGQFHPEFRSRPTRPHPLFREFVGAATALADARDRAAQAVPAARVPARNGADHDRPEPAVPAPASARRADGVDADAASATVRRPGGLDADAAAGPATAQRPAGADAIPAGPPRPTRPVPADGGQTVDLREDPAGRAPAPVAGDDGREARASSAAPAPDPTVYRRGDGEPDPEAPAEADARPSDPVPAGEPGRP
jgi:Glutamine amidotransferase class-I